jgi:ParB family transcriptional regulator, chromosome partitioning protein
MVMKHRPKIASKPVIPPAADNWVNRGGIDPEIQTETANPQNSFNTTLSLDQIHDRPAGDSRSLNQTHIEALAESIAIIGLIQPIAVDQQGQLLAGGHRVAAIKQLKTVNPPAYNQHFLAGIPIRRYDFDASQDPELALAIEATENEKRRDYTPTEVRELADRLKAAGYHHTKGRAKTGQKTLLPSLAVIVGKSERQIKRYLADETDTNLNGTHVPFSQKHLKQAVLSLKKFQSEELTTPKERKLLKELATIIDRLEQAIS